MQKEVLAIIIFIMLGCAAPENDQLEMVYEDSVPPIITPDTKEEISNTNVSGVAPEENSFNTISTTSAVEQEDSIEVPEEILSPEEQVWHRRIEVALEPTPCPDIAKPVYPSSYYQGPLTDTHLHIPSIPDWSPEEDNMPRDEAPEGRFGGPQALLGWNVKMSEIACTLKQEGTQDNFAFFPVYEGEISAYQLEMWNRTMQQYPSQFTPFIMSSGNDGEPDGFPTVDAATLQEMLAVYPGLFKGYGEIGLYARENGGSPELPPDSQRLQAIPARLIFKLCGTDAGCFENFLIARNKCR